MGQAMPYLSLMKAKNSLIVSISTTPSGKTLQNAGIMQGEEKPSVPFLVGSLLDAVDSVRRMRASRWGVTYLYMFLEPNAKDLDTLTGYVEEGKVRPVVGTRVSMMDIEKVKEACNVIYNGKGGLGKTVIEVV
jgi:NADPH:quinone reductase-like Zn-dependent oxidoreductase